MNSTYLPLRWPIHTNLLIQHLVGPYVFSPKTGFLMFSNVDRLKFFQDFKVLLPFWLQWILNHFFSSHILLSAGKRNQATLPILCSEISSAKFSISMLTISTFQKTRGKFCQVLYSFITRETFPPFPMTCSSFQPETSSVWPLSCLFLPALYSRLLRESLRKF